MDATLSDIPAVIQSCVIVGGGGYLGNKLAASLENYGCDVKLFDKSPTPASYSKSSSFVYVSLEICKIDRDVALDPLIDTI